VGKGLEIKKRRMGNTHPPNYTTNKQRKELITPQFVVGDVRPGRKRLSSARIGGYPAFPPVEIPASSSIATSFLDPCDPSYSSYNGIVQITLKTPFNPKIACPDEYWASGSLLSGRFRALPGCFPTQPGYLAGTRPSESRGML